MQRHTPQHTGTSPGFTLLELAIVIGVIALLASISFAVIGNMLATAKQAATKTTILKISGLLGDQAGGFLRQYDPDSVRSKTLAGNYRPGGTYPLTADRQTSAVLAKKAAYLQAFPQNLYEAAGFDRTVGTRDDIELFTDWLANNTVSKADSSELLFLALTQGKVRGASQVDESAFSGSEIGDTDGDGFKEFIDAWGEPLRFYRWPTRLINPFGYVADLLSSNVNAATTSIPVSGSAFNSIPTPFGVVVGREIMEVSSVSGSTLTVMRGARSTEQQAHKAGATVKIAPYIDLASLLLGDLNSSVLAHDPDDPRGLTSQTTTSGGFANIVNLTGTPFPSFNPADDYELIFHTLDSYQAPLIVSAGEDGVLGLVEPGPTGSTGTTYEPQNFWLPSGTTSNMWRWGALAQPDTQDGMDFSVILNPGSSPLADNLSNFTVVN